MKAKIRGIYSTALTKLLLDNGFEIVQPSFAIKQRFRLTDDLSAPDVKIKDRYDLQGIRVLGIAETVNALQSILQAAFEDVITRKWAVSVDGIYKGKITETDENTVYVNINENITGRLPKLETTMTEEKPLLVQVERKRIGAKQPILNADLKIVGTYAILIQNAKIGVSLKISDLNKRAELYALGKMLVPEGWGIIWRESSANQSKEQLESEIEILVEKVKALGEKVEHAEAPVLLIEGSRFMDVEFPWSSKKDLDKLRASVAPTLDMHHFYKSCGDKVSAALEMAEKVLEKENNAAETERLLKEQISHEFPEEGSQVDVEHVKLSGIVFLLGKATIESFTDGQLKFSRIMRSNGFYDGLNTKKDAGDKAVSETRLNEWYIITKYFSVNEEWKGTYVNLNTPVEVYPNAMRYVDLEVDVCVSSDGTKKILDIEKLENTLEKGFISRKLFETIKQKAKEVAESLEQNKL